MPIRTLKPRIFNKTQRGTYLQLKPRYIGRPSDKNEAPNTSEAIQWSGNLSFQSTCSLLSSLFSPVVSYLSKPDAIPQNTNQNHWKYPIFVYLINIFSRHVSMSCHSVLYICNCFRAWAVVLACGFCIFIIVFPVFAPYILNTFSLSLLSYQYFYFIYFGISLRLPYILLELPGQGQDVIRSL